MTADSETLVVAAYVFAKELPSLRRWGRPPLIEDEELIALAVAQAASGICSDRQFLGIVGRLLPGWFPRLPDQTQYNRRLRSLAPRLVWVQQRLAAQLASGKLRVADGTLIGVANYAGCGSRSEFAGPAAYGYCAAKSRYYWGMRLVLLTDRRGLPVGYTLVAANEREYEPVCALALGDGCRMLLADKGLGGGRVRRDAASGRHRHPHAGSPAHSRHPRARAAPGLAAPGDRVDDRQPQMPDAPGGAPRQDPGGSRRAHRRSPAGAHARHVPQRRARPSAAQPGDI